MQTLLQPQSIQAIFFDVGYTMLAPHPSVQDVVQWCVRATRYTGRSILSGEHLPHAEATLRGMVTSESLDLEQGQLD